MRKKKSRLICKCGTRGGVLTLRRAGNSNTKNALYVQHYDPAKRSGKRPCYISRQNISLIKITDKRYFKEYKSLVEEYVRKLKLKDYSTAGNNELDFLSGRAMLLLIDMRWPNRVVSIADKFYADVTNVQVLNVIRHYQDTCGIKLTREQVFKRLSIKSRFKMAQDEKKWWEEIAKSGSKILQGNHNNNS